LVLPAGDSQIFVQALPLGYYVQSIFAGTLDILRFPFAVSETPLPEVVVMLTRTAPLSDPPTVTVRGRVNNVPSDATPRWVVLQSAPAGTIAFGVPSTIGEVPLQVDGSFEVHGVPPGNYTIVPTQTGQSSAARATLTVPAGGLDGFEIAWAPPRPARGAPSVTAAPVFNIRGKVTTFPGAVLPTAIRLTPFAARQTKQQTTISADGSFEFTGIGQGSWDLRIGSEVLFNARSLSVAKQDVVGIEINAPVELRGRVVMADGSIPMPVFQIQNEFAAGNSVGTPTVRTLPAQREFDIRSDGTFSVGVVPGQQRISVLGLPLSYSVKSIAYGAVDLGASPLLLTDIPTGEILVMLERTNVPEGPPRFSFVYQYGHDTLQHPNVIDTSRGTFTQDMVSDLSQTFNLRLDDAELKQVEDMLDAIDFWNAEKYPTVFTMPNPGPMGCSSTGRQPIFLLVRRGDVSKELTWMDQDSVCTPNQAGKDLRSLMNLIRGILEGKPEYQKLPRPAGMYID
jgi:hypothetical protein